MHGKKHTQKQVTATKLKITKQGAHRKTKNENKPKMKTDATIKTKQNKKTATNLHNALTP